jgi:ketosteroid isomerase-like protein
MLDLAADDLADLYAVDAVHEMPFLIPWLPERLSGREEVRAAYRAAWARLDADIQEVRDVAVHAGADSEVIIVEQVMAGVLRSTGQRFEFPSVVVLRVRDGEIVHARDYTDGLGVARSLGRLPAVARALGQPAADPA